MEKMTKTISPEMKKRIVAMLQRTWQVIMYDTIETFGSMDRDDVISTTADYLYCYGKDNEAKEVFLSLPWEEAAEIGKEAFPCPVFTA